VSAPDVSPPDVSPPDVSPPDVTTPNVPPSSPRSAQTRVSRPYRRGRVTYAGPALDTEIVETEYFEPRPWWASGLALLTFGGLTGVAAYVGFQASHSSVDDWYESLEKPVFTPPNWVFGPVWGGMYALTALSGWRVWRAPSSRQRTAALVLWGAQILLNGAWSPLFFGRRQPRTALADLVALGITTGTYALMARKVDRTATMMVLPYLGWLGFAGALNEEIVRLNRPVASLDSE